jgi:hypothetical protein
MTENQQDRKAATEEAGGYGTPTVEQEMAGGAEQKAAKKQDSAGQAGAGRSGGTEEQVTAENASTDPGFDADARPNAQAAMPSSEAEMDDANTDEPDAGRPFSSESGQDAAGLPDGSGTDLPESDSPKDREGREDTFDAG